MKQLLSIIIFTFLSTVYGQTADEYLKSGIEKHNSKDYEGAIKEYSKAVKADKDLKVGYYNRGVCELGLKDLKSAKKEAFKTSPESKNPFYGFCGYS